MKNWHLTKLNVGRPKGTTRPDPRIAKAFGQVIRDLRQNLECSQEAIADIIGIDRNYIARIERGEVSPTLTLIFRISWALDVGGGELPDRTAKRFSDAEIKN